MQEMDLYRSARSSHGGPFVERGDRLEAQLHRTDEQSAKTCVDAVEYFAEFFEGICGHLCHFPDAITIAMRGTLGEKEHGRQKQIYASTLGIDPGA